MATATIRDVDIMGRSTTYTYDARDGVLVGAGKDSPSGRTTAYAYDSAGSILTTIDVMGSANTYAYGIDDRTIVGSYDQGGTTYAYTYDRATGLITTIDAPADARTTYAYDVEGDNVIGTYTDTSGLSHRFLYDMRSRTFSRSDIDGATHSYGYGLDRFGNEAGYITDGNAETFGFLRTVPAPPGAVLIVVGVVCCGAPGVWRRLRAGPRPSA